MKRTRRIENKIWGRKRWEDVLPSPSVWTPEEMVEANERLCVRPLNFTIDFYLSVNRRGITERHF